MMHYIATRTAALSLVAALAWTAAAQPANPNQQNDLKLCNGADGVFIISSPSVGSPTGTNPPNINGDRYWKVFPKEALHIGTAAAGPNPPGTMEISGFQFDIYDTNWTTPPAFCDLLFAPGQPSTANPGNIVPNFASPSAIFVSLGPSGLPNPCTANPALCGGGTCPAGGQITGYTIDIQLGTGPGTGIAITADGTQDYTVSAFLQGGMATTGGTCGAGDYVTTASYSASAFPGGVGEQQPNWLGSGYSAYGGVRAGGMGVTVPDAVNSTAFFTLEFIERTLTARVDMGNGTPPDDGLVTLHLPTTSGLTSIGFESYSYQGVSGGGGPSSVLMSGTATTLPIPGIGGLLLDPADVLFTFILNLAFTGSYVYVPPAAGPGAPAGGFHDGIFQSYLLPLPAGTGPFTISFQAADFAATGVSLTNVFTVAFIP